jgi:hypothetical protein
MHLVVAAVRQQRSMALFIAFGDHQTAVPFISNFRKFVERARDLSAAEPVCLRSMYKRHRHSFYTGAAQFGYALLGCTVGSF